MHLLIIGASGFVGKHVLYEAIKRGHWVLGTQKSTKHPKFLLFDQINDSIADCVPSSFIKSDNQSMRLFVQLFQICPLVQTINY